MSQPVAVKHNSPWAPLKNSTFRWLWLATLVSNIGSWMHEVGAGWLMTTLTTSPVISPPQHESAVMSKNA
ncbi:MAG: MFS transporter, partial [Pseudomonadota bacterium]